MDVAAVTVNYLTSATNVQWYHDAPEDTPDSFGTLTRDGGPTELVRDMPTLTLMCHGATRGDAADLATLTKRALLLMPYSVENVFSAEVLGDYYDPLDGRHRHRITASLLVND